MSCQRVQICGKAGRALVSFSDINYENMLPPLVVDFKDQSYKIPEVNSHVQMINDLCFKSLKQEQMKGVPVTI